MKIHRYTFIKKRIITTNLDDFTGDAPSTPKDVNIPDVSIAPKGEMDLLFYRDPMCPLCLSSNVSKNGTFVRTLESGQPIIVQKYICNDCGHSFDARPPNYGYGNHFSNETKKKTVKGRVKTSLRNVKSFFLDLLEMSISHETVRKSIPAIPNEKYESSGYFVYDEQYSHIDGKERYRTLLKDSKIGRFIEEIIDDLSEERIGQFILNALSHFHIPNTITITTDGYHYENVLKETSRRLGIRIRRQRCLFHIEKDLAHNIEDSPREEELEPAKRLVKYMFFQNGTNLNKLGKNKEAVLKLTEGKIESEKVDLLLEKIESMYGEYPEIRKFLDLIKKHRKEVFLYLKNSEVEKTSDKAEQHFSIQSWLFKNRFKTKEGLLRTSYWYHHYLSTGM